MLQFIRRLFLAIFSPGLLAKIKIAIAAVDLVKDALASNKLDDLVNVTKTAVDNDVLFWARRVVKYLTDWLVIDEKDVFINAQKRATIQSDFPKISAPARNAIYLRLAVQTLQDMTINPKDRSVTVPEDRAIIFVQTVYSKQKQKNEN
ncbi:MAG: hypothetical protein IPP15_16000 [Saprospiraceae bacterium]|uniref:Uncharacterized protein n=1 Tax=Candidatus Opimibacter skivensis TaxID=2982028 RepID=A0A9D7XQ59_9BACT|nr:hypothetical protein [Candidatus Opimibacter skivensis]